MARKYASLDNLKFLLYDVHNIEELFDYEYFKEFTSATIDMMLDASIDFSNRELFPFLSEMDRRGVAFEDGRVTVHPQIYNVLRKLGESDWINATRSFESGGMQLPQMMHYATEFIYTAANNPAIGYAMLTAGASKLIYSFGNDELKMNYATNMLAGKWQGTMAMTEPQAGSSLSYITTRAQHKSDGTYKITGQKIFISGGDYEGIDNIVHLVLARIDGSPKGTKGISLFVVPKMRVERDGNLADNDVITAGIFEKMGQHGYVTTHLVMGEQDNCVGYLVGEENNGLAYMFQMMNAARIGVGLMGAAIASAAYYASLEYAQERPQGRHAGSKNRDEKQVTIIHHADVRRMLFLQKAVVEGSLSLIMECAKYMDLSAAGKGEKYELLLDLLTPIVKTYPTEMGIVSVSNGLQCLGGYGYCVDFPLEQLYRDIRIATIYEGTTGIQSIDLLGRKMIMNDGRSAKLLAQAISTTIQESAAFERLKPDAKLLEEVVVSYKIVLKKLVSKAVSGRTESFLADANLFMEFCGLMVIGWQWLKQGISACKLLEKNAENVLFYESKIRTLRYYFSYELPKTQGLITRLLDNEDITLKEEKEYLI